MSVIAKTPGKSQSDRKRQAAEVMFRNEVRKWGSSFLHMALLSNYS